jgi:hypothetical protein
MALKTIAKITLYEPLNQDKIDAILAGTDTVLLEIERKYQIGVLPEILSAVLPTQFDDVSIDYIEALKLVIDASTWIHEENVVHFIIEYDSLLKEFDLTNSFVRDKRNTTSVMSSVVTGQLLYASFETPGLDGSVKTLIQMPFGQTLDLDELNVLKDRGVIIDPASTGDFFTITTQSVPYKVVFFQPETIITEKYIIDFPLQNKIIEL